MKIAIHGKSTNLEAQACISDIFKAIDQRGIEADISAEYQSDLKEKSFSTSHLNTFDLGEDLVLRLFI